MLLSKEKGEMHKKKVGTFFTILVTLLLCAVTTPINVLATPLSTKVYIDPPKIIDLTLLPNDTFTIDVKVENVPEDPGVVGVEFEISWDSTLLEGVSMVLPTGHFLEPDGDEGNVWKLFHEVEPGYVHYAYTFLDITRGIERGYLPKSGNGTLATIELKVIGIGSCVIDLYGTILGDPDGNIVDHDALDGYFRNAPIPPAQFYVDPPKILNLTLVPCENFTINVNILNATNLYSFEFKLGFDSNILYANHVEPGDMLPPEVTPDIKINNTAGYVWFNASLFPLYMVLEGNGTLATITFHVEGLGRTVLDLYDTELIDLVGEPLPHDVSDGSFNNILLAKLVVEPEEIIDPSLLPPSTFKINVTIADVEDLYGYEFNLTFNPDVLICLKVEIHDVLNETNYIPSIFMNNIKGFAWVNVAYYPPAEPLTIYPSTPLVTIELRVKAIGSSNLTLHNTNLIDQLGEPIPHETFDGYFCTLIRDVAVIDLTASPIELYESWETNITVTVRNEGDITETFNVTFYYDDFLIGIVTITNLASNENTTTTIAWDTEGVSPGNYTIRAEAAPVPYEIDITDNIFSDGIVRVKILGDLNGDDSVNILDALIGSATFGSYPGHPRWDSMCDLNRDKRVGILDMILLSRNFGKKI